MVPFGGYGAISSLTYWDGAIRFYRDCEVKEETRSRIELYKDYEGVPHSGVGCDKQKKGVWGMPGLPEAMKDAISCENPRGAAHEL